MSASPEETQHPVDVQPMDAGPSNQASEDEGTSAAKRALEKREGDEGPARKRIKTLDGEGASRASQLPPFLWMPLVMGPKDAKFTNISYTIDGKKTTPVLRYAAKTGKKGEVKPVRISCMGEVGMHDATTTEGQFQILGGYPFGETFFRVRKGALGDAVVHNMALMVDGTKQTVTKDSPADAIAKAKQISKEEGKTFAKTIRKAFLKYVDENGIPESIADVVTSEAEVEISEIDQKIFDTEEKLDKEVRRQRLKALEKRVAQPFMLADSEDYKRKIGIKVDEPSAEFYFDLRAPSVHLPPWYFTEMKGATEAEQAATRAKITTTTAEAVVEWLEKTYSSHTPQQLFEMYPIKGCDTFIAWIEFLVQNPFVAPIVNGGVGNPIRVWDPPAQNLIQYQKGMPDIMQLAYYNLKPGAPLLRKYNIERRTICRFTFEIGAKTTNKKDVSKLKYRLYCIPRDIVICRTGKSLHGEEKNNMHGESVTGGVEMDDAALDLVFNAIAESTA